MLRLDTETCGLHGVATILQFAKKGDSVSIHEFWREPVRRSMHIIEDITNEIVVGFNLAFDWFHLQKIYNMFERIGNKLEPPSIQEMASVEKAARDGSCIKPVSAFDLMLHFRSTPLQSTMNRGDIRIRKVPTQLAQELADELTKRIEFDPLLFAVRRKFAPVFQVRDVDDKPHLKDIVLRFNASQALKSLAVHLLGASSVIRYDDIQPFRFPKEHGYAPFHEAVTEDWKKGKLAWPSIMQEHIDHWAYNKKAREYATDDVVYTAKLHDYVGNHLHGDTNSILACCVASCRWKGYAVDLEKLKVIIEKYKLQLKAPMSPGAVKEWILPHLTPIEQIMCRDKKTGKLSTSKAALHAMFDLEKPELDVKIKAVLAARKAKMKIQVLQKIMKAERFHASMKVVGTLSNRMSGTDQLNPQAIDSSDEVRKPFTMAFPDEDLTSGDMMSFEVGIADACYEDPELRKQLTMCEKCLIQVYVVDGKLKCPKCGGKETRKFHALFGMGFFNMTYEEILATKGQDPDRYKQAKVAAFSTLFGAQFQKLMDYFHISETAAIEGLALFWNTYKKAGAARLKIEREFTSIDPKDWSLREPKGSMDSLLGWTRHFQLENQIVKALYELTKDMPKKWKEMKIYTNRGNNKGEQLVVNAVRSALFGAAFGIQNKTIRQAANHEIQSTGAGITKETQRAVWDFQPAGVHKWMVRPLNIHDELQVPCDPSISDKVIEAVRAKVETFRPLIPLVAIDFDRAKNWSEK
jgi:exosome complex RNA-binding protein Csl4